MRKKPSLKISFFAFQDIITSTTGILILITLILTFFLNADAVLGESDSVDDLKEKLKKIEQKITQTQADITKLEKLLAEWGDADPKKLAEEIEKLKQELAKLQSEIDDLGEDAKEALKLAAMLAMVQQRAMDLDEKIMEIKQAMAEMQTKAREAAAANILFPSLDPRLVNQKLLLVVLGRGKYELFQYNAGGRTGVRYSTLSALTGALKAKAGSSFQLVFFVRPSGLDDFIAIHGPAVTRGRPSDITRMGYRSIGWDALDEDALLFGGK